jgi:KTSC domain
VTHISLDLICARVLTLRRPFPQMIARSLLLFSLLGASKLAVANSVDDNVRSEARNPVISHIPRARVDSNAIASIGYSKRRHILEIEFVSGAVYRYLEVVPSVYRDLMIADSKARYYVANIKGNYPSVRVRPRAKP